MKRSIIVRSSTGYEEHFVDGEYHRVDGPACEYADGSKYWYLNGQRHRVDGPAVKLLSGSKFWYLHGQRHRIDGPAIELYSGQKLWYINGKRLSKNEELLRNYIYEFHQRKNRIDNDQTNNEN